MVSQRSLPELNIKANRDPDQITSRNNRNSVVLDGVRKGDSRKKKYR